MCVFGDCAGYIDDHDRRDVVRAGDHDGDVLRRGVGAGSAVVGDCDRVGGGDGFTISEILRQTVGNAEVPSDRTVVGSGLG